MRLKIIPVHSTQHRTAKRLDTHELDAGTKREQTGKPVTSDTYSCLISYLEVLSHTASVYPAMFYFKLASQGCPSHIDALVHVTETSFREVVSVVLRWLYHYEYFNIILLAFPSQNSIIKTLCFINV